MPAVTSGKVLVTGANGFVGIWVAKAYLEHGFSVRGTVRSESKAKHLRQVFQSYDDKFEIAIVDDIAKVRSRPLVFVFPPAITYASAQDGAFDEAVKGVDVIAHTASPFHTHGEDPNEYIAPAVQGTLSVLNSTLKYGMSVKRVVVTATVGTIINIGPGPRVFSEKDWNEHSIREVNEKGSAAHPLDKYGASKTLAERAAWDFHSQHKNEVAWDVTTIHPPFVFGPVLHEVDKPENLNESSKAWWDIIVAGQLTGEALAQEG